jgi:hypothetical protein
MEKSNLILLEYPEHGVDLEVEISSLPVRINNHGTKDQIGVCIINGVGIDQAIIKLLYIDSTERKKIRHIHKALAKMGASFGFKEKLFQRRKKDGTFLTFMKKIINN